MSVQSVGGEHMSCFCTGISMSLEDESDIFTKNNECVLHRHIEFVLVFITYYTFDVDFMDFCKFTLGTTLYNNVVPAMRSSLRDHIAVDHIKTNRDSM